MLDRRRASGAQPPGLLRRAQRQLRRALDPHAASVVFHPRYGTAFASLPTDPLRAERTLAFLAAQVLISKRQVRRARPASLKSLARVHTDAYLETIHEPAVLEHIFGDTVTQDQVDRLLDQQRLMTGGTKLATHLALAHRSLAINLGGGLHHAQRDRGAGLCIFNDVAVAIVEARQRGFGGKVLVIDLDLHDGNGTRAVFASDPSVHTFSIHAQHWGEVEAVASTSLALGMEVDDRRYLEALNEALPPVVKEFRPDLVIYLAGVDVASDDRLGDWQLTAGGILSRDRMVLDLVRGRRLGRGTRLPLVIVLAGGYGSEAWRYNARFLALALSGKVIEPPSTEVMTLARIRQRSRQLDPVDLSGGRDDDNFGLSEADLALPGWGVRRETRLLGFYTKHGLELALERAGILDRLRDLGYSHPLLEFDLEDSGGHCVRIWGSPERCERLAEVRLERDRRTLPGLTLLGIEWLQLQNPRAAFGAGRQQLPGQEHPGLGMGYEAVALCAVAAERLHLDGVVWTPAYFHTAGAWQDVALPTDAVAAARLRALARLFADVPLERASEAVRAGEVVERSSGEPVSWQPVPMVLPLSAAAKAWAQERRGEIDAHPLPDLEWQEPDRPESAPVGHP